MSANLTSDQRQSESLQVCKCRKRPMVLNVVWKAQSKSEIHERKHASESKKPIHLILKKIFIPIGSKWSKEKRASFNNLRQEVCSFPGCISNKAKKHNHDSSLKAINLHLLVNTT